VVFSGVTFINVIIFDLIEGVCDYIRRTNHVYKVRNVAPIQWLQYTVHVKLFPTIKVLCFTLVLPGICLCGAYFGCLLHFFRVELSKLLLLLANLFRLQARSSVYTKTYTGYTICPSKLFRIPPAI
jgi:hypothetical protein